MNNNASKDPEESKLQCFYNSLVSFMNIFKHFLNAIACLLTHKAVSGAGNV